MTEIPDGPSSRARTLRQPDHAPLGRRIGSAEGVAETARDGRHVDDGAGAFLLHHRDRAAGAQEHAGQVDIDAAAPIRRRDILDRRRRPGDAGVVDQYVKPAEDQPERRRTAGPPRRRPTRRRPWCPRRNRFAAGRQRAFVHVADMNPGAGAGQRPRDGETDAGRAGRHSTRCPVGIEISHVVPSPRYSQNCTVLSFDHKSNITLESKALEGIYCVKAPARGRHRHGTHQQKPAPASRPEGDGAGPRLSATERADPERRHRTGPHGDDPEPVGCLRRQRHAGARSPAPAGGGEGADGGRRTLGRHPAAQHRPAGRPDPRPDRDRGGGDGMGGAGDLGPPIWRSWSI